MLLTEMWGGRTETITISPDAFRVGDNIFIVIL